MLEQSPDLAIAALVQADPDPGVAALGRIDLDGIEVGRPILELDPAPQPLQYLVRRRSPEPHQVLTPYLARGVHEPMSEFAVIGEQQETGGIHVEPTHHDPSPTHRWRQSLEYGRPALRIIARGHLADGLVIQQYFNRILSPAEVQRFPVETNPVRAFGAIAERRDPIVDGHATGTNPVFDSAP